VHRDKESLFQKKRVRRFALAAGCFLMVVANPARADSLPATGPTESAVLAKAKLERDKADLHELVVARATTARACYEARRNEFLAGRGTLQFLLDTSLRLLTAELAMDEQPGARFGALERYWGRTRLFEMILEDRCEAGRIPVKDYTQVKGNRLEAEIWLIAAKGRPEGGPTPGGLPWALRAELGNPLEPGMEIKDFARARYRAGESSTRDLARQRYEAALVTLRSREGEFIAGRGTLEFVHEVALTLLEAELALGGPPADRLGALERYWELLKRDEEINRERFEAGRIPIQDVADSKYQRIVAEIRLKQAQAEFGGLRENSRRPCMWWYEDMTFPDDPLPPKELAKAKYAAATSDLQELARERRDAARIVYEARKTEFDNGRGTLRFLLDCSHRLLESDLALCRDRTERIAALERHWERAVRIEGANAERFRRGRIPIQDHLESKYVRLDAEIKLARAR
jgi:hypothetical protein